MLISIILLILGFVLLTKGADYFVEGASSLALKFKIPQIVIGLTIVAMGTSLPEASVSINSAIKGVEGVAIGNIIGSNIANVLLILGLTALIRKLPIQKNTVKFEIPFVIFITVLLFFFGYYFHSITRLCAIIFILLFVLFLFYLYKISKNVDEVDEDAKNFSILKILIFITGGIIALIYGSDLTINSAIDIAQKLNISDRIIGLTIVAIGTSLPELVTCIIAAFKNQSDLAIGNIVGSNIFNILFVLGITGVILPVKFENAFYFDTIVAILSTLLLLFFTFKKQCLSRIQGGIFFILYLAYIIYTVLK